jgi:hypothetical protein
MGKGKIDMMNKEQMKEAIAAEDTVVVASTDDLADGSDWRDLLVSTVQGIEAAVVAKAGLGLVRETKSGKRQWDNSVRFDVVEVDFQGQRVGAIDILKSYAVREHAERYGFEESIDERTAQEAIAAYDAEQIEEAEDSDRIASIKGRSARGSLLSMAIAAMGEVSETLSTWSGYFRMRTDALTSEPHFLANPVAKVKKAKALKGLL